MKIALIIPYFGKFPEYFDLYLYSCSRNSFIDFHYYTDCKIPERCYDNTIFHKTTFVDYCQFVSKQLDFNFNPEEPYKLCDLKPFYGIVHQELLKDYDWWGFGDIDVVYGDLSLLVNEKNLNRYSLITTHWHIIAGHFTLIKKESKYTKICLNIPDYKYKLSDNKNYALDESALTKLVKNRMLRYFDTFLYILYDKINKNKWLYYTYGKIGKTLEIFHRNILFREVHSTFLPKNNVISEYNLETGKLKIINNQLNIIDEAMTNVYIHFLHYKNNPYYQTDNYWREGYFRIAPSYDFSQGGIVEITNDSIQIRK